MRPSNLAHFGLATHERPQRTIPERARHGQDSLHAPFRDVAAQGENARALALVRRLVRLRERDCLLPPQQIGHAVPHVRDGDHVIAHERDRGGRANVRVVCVHAFERSLEGSRVICVPRIQQVAHLGSQFQALGRDLRAPVPVKNARVLHAMNSMSAGHVLHRLSPPARAL